MIGIPLLYDDKTKGEMKVLCRCIKELRERNKLWGDVKIMKIRN